MSAEKSCALHPPVYRNPSRAASREGDAAGVRSPAPIRSHEALRKNEAGYGRYVGYGRLVAEAQVGDREWVRVVRVAVWRRAGSGR